MARYPISHNAGKKLEEFFYDLLTFHVPFGEHIAILDPTCGKKYLWKRFFRRSLLGGKTIDRYGKVVFSDIKDFGQEIVNDFRDLDFDHEFNAIVFDPPYLFGYEGSDDERKEDYGDYKQSFRELLNLMYSAHRLFPGWLKKDGKLIMKCSDQFYVKEKTFYPLHIRWANVFTGLSSHFRLIDFYVFIHHRISPTAFQVKDRPCAVIMHTYFMVFEPKV